jgi:hypothetical protein
MDILPLNSMMPTVIENRHEDKPPQSRQPRRKKQSGATPSLYTPNGHLTENSVHKIDIVG